MACRIEPHCSACGICVAVCPVNAILETAGGTRISDLLCTECLGYAEAPVCMYICPSGAIAFASRAPWQPNRGQGFRAHREIFG
ncbi:MAG: 4Fe-4S binding protein [Bryobacterales bacterium]|nr:4Fe-4S binding protein [Bryobacterales bacterium]